LVNELKKADDKSAESAEPGKVRGLKYGKEGQFYRIHFDRPEKFNSITVEMYRGLNEAMKEANEDPSVKFTVFSGKSQQFLSPCITHLFLASGPYYCAGNDLTTFAKIKTREDLKQASEQGAVILEEFVNAFIDHNKPIIALIHGPAIGISVTTLALCDVILASDKVVDVIFVCTYFIYFRLLSKLRSLVWVILQRVAVLTRSLKSWVTLRFSTVFDDFNHSVLGQRDADLW
jgi:1,4-dihydroxy-2-naphthoyl-CoA synthase